MQMHYTEVQLTPCTSAVIFTPESGLNSGYTRPCICDRKPALVMCPNKQCDFASGGGRVRKNCPSHPQITFLMDLPRCPKCGSDCDELDAKEVARLIKKNVSLSSPTVNQQQPPKIKQQANMAENRSKYRPVLSAKNKAPSIQQSTKKNNIVDRN